MISGSSVLSPSLNSITEVPMRSLHTLVRPAGAPEATAGNRPLLDHGWLVGVRRPNRPVKMTFSLLVGDWRAQGFRCHEVC